VPSSLCLSMLVPCSSWSSAPSNIAAWWCLWCATDAQSSSAHTTDDDALLQQFPMVFIDQVCRIIKDLEWMNERRDFGRGKVVLFIDRRREVEMCGWLASQPASLISKKLHGPCRAWWDMVIGGKARGCLLTRKSNVDCKQPMAITVSCNEISKSASTA
jgi:hypothetical protein